LEVLWNKIKKRVLDTVGKVKRKAKKSGIIQEVTSNMDKVRKWGRRSTKTKEGRTTDD
jgi:hypothetical protein